MDYSVFSATRKSPHHQKNEDSLFIGDDILIVADGMGGESDGDIASKIAVDTIEAYFKENRPSSLSAGQMKEAMFATIHQADANILQYTLEHPASAGMGTTVLLLIAQGNELFIAWCGDSRCYLHDGKHISSISKDHSYVQELIDAKESSVEDSYSHPDNNLITRYVGGGDEYCVPEFTTYTMRESDMIVMCSDGVAGYCRDAEVEACIEADSDYVTLPERLLDTALVHGSDDDITVIVMSRRQTEAHHSIFSWFKHRNH